VLLVAVVAVPLAAGIASWLLATDRLRYRLAVATSLLTLALALTLIARVLQHGPLRAFNDWLYLDHLGAVVLLVVTLVSAMAALYSVAYFRSSASAHVVRAGEMRKYFALFHLFVFTMVLAAVAGNLGLLWTAVTATTFASAPLVDFYGSHGPLEAAWKFIILAVAGELIALFGFLCLYASAIGWLGGSYNFTVPVLHAVGPHLSPALGTLGFLLVLVGFGTKAGLAPMHTWLPDAHSQAPAPICAMLSGAELNCAMLAILRVLALVTPAERGGSQLHSALLAFGLLSMTVGVIFLISQRDFKRLLAYSSVEQMGLIAAGIGLGAPLAVFGALLQMLVHSLAKCLMFFNAGNLLLRFRTTTIRDVRGVVRVAPMTAVLVVAGALAIGGAPPFGLFLSEASIIAGGIGAGAWAAAGFIAVLLVVGFIALVAPFSRMAFGEGHADQLPPRAELGAAVLLPGYLLLTAVLVLGVFIPGPLHTLLAAAAREVRG
ncbi:MAG TPA: proton-conducting transporter membrane subunit, partial [Candidatus Dormibacteraeota bacterium]|nr:proton-conducting transporter membrane subunit [Candidatus Dormibacteraeota bacterium]